MTTTMNCPGCQAPLRVREDLAGKKIKCPRCGAVVTVPAEEVLTVEEVSAAEITAEPPPPRSRTKTAATRPCPECGEPIARTARECRYCQASFDDDEDDEDRRPSRSSYKPCPRCGEEGAKRVIWTPWGSFYGPALLNHVRCPGCGYAYNGKTGGSNLIPAVIFVAVPLLGILGILGSLGWFLYHQLRG
jgi:predicted RNA-binding Zn-ribbon protein involved in translation (DUF1610 family)